MVTNFKLTDADIKTIENFITKDNPFMEFEEMQSIVKMNYNLYRRLTTPNYQEGEK